MEVSRVKGVAAELRLQPLDGAAAPRALPEDLLAVLGLPWSRLVLRGGVWRASVVLRGGGAARSADAESRLLTTLQHLAAVLAAPPGTFHDRFRAARWRASARRGVPLAVCLGLIGASAAVPRLELGTDSVFRMLIFNAPPLLLLWMVAMRELPRIEIPPLPRRPAPDAWTPATPCLPTP
jgi:predicted nucleic acid-binding protein